MSFSWAVEQWSYKVDSIYLDKKDELDQASCFIYEKFGQKSVARIISSNEGEREHFKT